MMIAFSLLATVSSYSPAFTRAMACSSALPMSPSKLALLLSPFTL